MRLSRRCHPAGPAAVRRTARRLLDAVQGLSRDGPAGACTVPLTLVSRDLGPACEEIQ